ncbi:Aspartate aminotransferase [Entamoeba marina]
MLSAYMQAKCTSGTMIRKMSGLADELKKTKGIAETESALCHGYSSTVGDLAARKSMANIINEFEEVKIDESHLVLTAGCAAACNIFLRTILEKDDEVIIFSPYFLEYPFYIENYGGKCVIVKTRFEDKWQINTDLFKEKLTKKTRCVLINSPNNPTGVVYSQSHVDELIEIVKQQSEANGRPIWILNDDVYSRVVAPNVQVHSVFSYPYSVIAYSLSKDLSIAGERVGCLAVNPNLKENALVVSAVAAANEIVGIVHANKLHMRILPYIEKATVNISLYDETRNIVCKCFDELGIEYIQPEDYDEWEFCKTLAENGIVTVPGSAFDAPGFYRISLCKHPKDIEKT